MKKHTLLTIIVPIFTILACNSQHQGIKNISLQVLKTEVIGKDVQFIDVRTREEYQNGHIDDAVNIDVFDKKNFRKQAKKLNKNEPIYLYCKAGGRSNKASKILQ